MPFFYFDYTYLIYVVPALILSFAAQAAVKNAFSKYDKVFCQKSFTAHEITRRILDANGLNHIKVESVSGSLTDHYDPKAGVIRLSDTVRSSTSVAAIGVAAHEAGHAVQYKRGYVPIKLRNMFLPVANIGSRLSMPLILLGILLSAQNLVSFGIILFSAIVLFQIITLPVEFNASRRAKETLLSMGILTEQETKGAAKVLSAAAMTYVAATLVSLMQLLRLVNIFSKKRN